MSVLTVRAARPEDVPLILSLVRGLAEYSRALEKAVATEEDLRRQLFDSRPAWAPPIECLIGEIDGEAQGFALFFPNFSTWLARPGLYLEDLYVRPASRGRGLGRALLTEIARLAVSRGCARVEWSVLDWNAPSIAFYRAAGAVAQDDSTTYRLSGDALDALASR